jgi:subtilisin-like proprotein convertase family protein
LTATDSLLSNFADVTVTVNPLVTPPTGSTQTFTNAAAITINASGPAATYPSNLTVSGFPVGATISKVVVKVNNLSHTFSKDIDMLLVGPGDQRVTLMSDAGGTTTGTTAVATNVTLTFDATAASALSATSKVVTGTYRPMNLSPSGTTADSFPAPGPAAPYTATDLGVFTGLTGASLNGVWKLFVVDDTTGDSGSIAGGYSLTITTQ